MDEKLRFIHDHGVLRSSNRIHSVFLLLRWKTKRGRKVQRHVGSWTPNMASVCRFYSRRFPYLTARLQQLDRQVFRTYLHPVVPNPTPCPICCQVGPSIQSSNRIICRRSLLAGLLCSLCTYDVTSHSLQISAILDREHQVKLCMINSNLFQRVKW